MEGSKPFWQSVTFWGGFIAVAVSAVELAVAWLGDNPAPDLRAYLTLAGGVLAIIGRKVAKTNITFTVR